MSKRLLIGTCAGLTTALAILLGGLLATDPAAEPPASSAPSALAEEALTGFPARNTTSEIPRLTEEARRTNAATAYALLGLAYQQRARETTGAEDYARSERALRSAIARDRANVYALNGLGSLALTRHRFRDALALGRRAQRISPTTARTYGVIGDAQLELGRYDQAVRSYDRMAALKPGLSAYARVSHARELLGDRRGAAAAMRLAVDAAGAQAEPLAWTRVQLGKLLLSGGELRSATQEFRAALAAYPGYVHALDGLAQTEAARGRFARAIALQRRAVQSNPVPEVVGFLGDLYQATGRLAKARAQYALVREAERTLRANGERNELETALFDADRGFQLRRAVERARRGRQARPSIEGDDVLGWALARSGRCDEALVYSKRSLRLGTRDALKYFHRGMIERCLDHDTSARDWFRRALRLNPHFSLRWSAVARRYAS